MRVLALDAALARGTAGLVVDGRLVVLRETDAAQGAAVRLPALVDVLLAEAAVTPDRLDMLAVTVGPGSFTGIRAALALAHGLGVAAGIPVIGVTVGEAIAAALSGLAGRRLWTAVDSKRGRIFLEDDGAITAYEAAALPAPQGPVAIAGDAAVEVAARLAARGADVMLTGAGRPSAVGVAAAGQRRLAGQLPPRPALPVYVDPPAARLPSGGLRPPPT
jgi:tRNA threonylcarbamoyladenosine biosynthesis protein TsaB